MKKPSSAMGTTKSRVAVVSTVVVVALATGAIAWAASGGGFTPTPTEPQGAEETAGEQQGAGDLVAPFTYSESTSLQAVRDANVPPFQWPWFAAEVDTPPDAVAAAPELRAAIARVPALRGMKLLSAEEKVPREGTGTTVEDPHIQWVWIKIDETELLRIGTQLIPEGTAVDIELGEVQAFHPGDGEAVTRAKPGAIFTRQIIGNRMVLVDLQTWLPETTLSLGEDDLIAIGAATIRAMDG